MRSVFTNYSENVLDAIEKQTQSGVEYYLKSDLDEHTPYTTICHRSLHDKNIMFKNGTSELFTE